MAPDGSCPYKHTLLLAPNDSHRLPPRGLTPQPLPVASLVADAFSMGMGDYLSEKAEQVRRLRMFASGGGEPLWGGGCPCPPSPPPPAALLPLDALLSPCLALARISRWWSTRGWRRKPEVLRRYGAPPLSRIPSPRRSAHPHDAFHRLPTPRRLPLLLPPVRLL